MTQIAHQPVGAIFPSTVLQAFGAMKMFSAALFAVYRRVLAAHCVLRDLGAGAERNQREGAGGAEEDCAAADAV